LASESAESIARFRYGLRDRKSAVRTQTVRARANVPGPIRGAKVLIRPDKTAKSGIGNVYVPQVGSKNPNEAEWRWYTLPELNSEVAQTVEPGAGLKFFLAADEGEQDEEVAMSKMKEQEEEFRSRLRELGLRGETKHISTTVKSAMIRSWQVGRSRFQFYRDGGSSKQRSELK
jgi:hypothetical protein